MEATAHKETRWENFPVKTLGLALGLIVLIVTSTVGIITFFQTRQNARIEHGLLAEYDERGHLENEQQITELEIRYLVRLAEMGELSASDSERLLYLRQKLARLEARLSELNRLEG